MFKTLALLAVTMTGTTVLLIHLEPAGMSTLLDPGQIQQAVRSAVGGADGIGAGSWSGVEIVLEREVALGRRDALAATSAGAGYHFWIGDHGEVSSAPDWAARSARPAGGVVRIALAERSGGSSSVQPQLAALRMLLGELQSLVAVDQKADALPWWLILSDQAAGDQPLQAYLRSEGWLG